MLYHVSGEWITERMQKKKGESGGAKIKFSSTTAEI